jgi:hypothetical protein
MKASITDIVRMEERYRDQMSSVRDSVLRFVEPKGWHLFSRGRTAHVSVCGEVNHLDGVIDIQMEEDDWDKKPASLQLDTSFSLSAHASLDRDGKRRFSDTILHWRVPFSILPDTVDRFLPRAWDMLKGLTEANLLDEWPGPSEDPAGPPDFGPPQRRVTQT